MPSFIGGPITITSAEGVVNFGDSFCISPKSIGKTYAGAGAFNTGNFVWSNSAVSATNTSDFDGADQPSVNA